MTDTIESIVSEMREVLNDMRPISPCLTEQLEGQIDRLACLAQQQGSLAVDPPRLPDELLDRISRYGAARSECGSEVDRIFRWEQLVAGIKHYARSYAFATHPAAVDEAMVESVGEAWDGGTFNGEYMGSIPAAMAALTAALLPATSDGERA